MRDTPLGGHFTFVGMRTLFLLIMNVGRCDLKIEREYEAEAANDESRVMKSATEVVRR